MSLLKNPWVLVGGALDIVGLGLVGWSLPEGGTTLAAGVVCLLAGAAFITRGTSRGTAGLESQRSTASTNWQLDSALRQPIPRKTRLRTLGKVIAAIWVCTLGALGWFAASRTVGLNPPIHSQSLVETHGLSLTAEIHDRVERTTADGEPRYYIYYRYEYPEGSEVRASVGVTRTLFGQYQVNDVIEIKLLPSDPPAVVVPAFHRDPFAVRGLLLGGIVAALLLFYLDGQRIRHKRLVARGLPVAGAVTTLTRRGASRTYHAEYRVGSNDYSVRASERNPSRREGNRVTVLHDPETPSDAVVYEAAFYEALS